MSALIAYRNLADSATVTGPENAGFPLTNLATRQLSTGWRSTSSGIPPVVISVDLGFTYTISVVALLSCQNIQDTLSTVKVSEDGVIWSTLYSFGGASDAGVPDLPRNIFKILDSPTLVQYLELSIVSASGDPLGFVGAGRLWVGDALVVPYGANSDWSIDTRERGTVDESAGLEIYPSAKPRGRELRMSFSPLKIALAYGTDDGSTALNVPSFQDLHTYAGAIGEVIAFPRSSGIWPRRVGVYGRVSEDSLSIRHLAGPNYSTDLRVIEER
jgi:hypothetical protein